MAKKIIKLPSISRVVAGATALLELPINPTYHNIQFVAAGTALAASMIKRIRVIVDGKTVQEFKDLTRLMDINSYHGRLADTVNNFTIHFKEDDLENLASSRTYAFGTQGMRTFNIEIELDATLAGDATLEAYAFVDTIPQPLGVFNMIEQTSLNSAVSGEIEYDKLAKNGAVYKQVHFFKSDITRIRLLADGTDVIDATKSILERLQKTVKPTARVPLTAKATHLDFVLEGAEGDMLNTAGVNDLRAKLEFGSAGVCEIVTEKLARFA
jgi:hypothetical protein